MRRRSGETHTGMRTRTVITAGAVLAATVGVVVAPTAAGRGGRHRDPVDAAGPLDIRAMAVEQAGRDVRLYVRTRGRFGLDQLNRRPDPAQPPARFLCLRLHRGPASVRQLCFGPQWHGHDVLGYARLRRSGSIRSFERIRARVGRHGPRAVAARFRASAAGLTPQVYFWRYLSGWRGPPCERGCSDRAPGRRSARLRLRPVQPVGCTDGPTPVFHGSRGRKRVALSFDDGPSAYTPKILRILNREHAKATFFEIGAQVPGFAASARTVIDSGDEIGNHSMHHEARPGSASMRETSRRIERATGFQPCLFRPPGGSFDSREVSDARGLGMSTVVWDVDPRDWSMPGAGAIYSRVVSAVRPGSIVVMHDGGGNRSQTVAALPQIIHTLHGRGYRMVTVTRLLNERTIWGEAR
jgi:peptidoglycan-N-acetylglucosamine deacetylase